jgi:hypothetical protein
MSEGDDVNMPSLEEKYIGKGICHACGRRTIPKDAKDPLLWLIRNDPISKSLYDCGYRDGRERAIRDRENE